MSHISHRACSLIHLIEAIVLLSLSISTTICVDIDISNNCDSWQHSFPVDETIFPFNSNCISLTYGRIHYIDLQPVDRKLLRTILAFHGNPVWSIIFAKIASKAFLNGYRFVALDYYGYGMSDKPITLIYLIIRYVLKQKWLQNLTDDRENKEKKQIFRLH